MRIRETDILTDGTVRLYRQRTDIPFGADNTLCIETAFPKLADLADAFALAQAQERKEAMQHPFAWNPEFGYVTAQPLVCGTGLQIHGLFHLEGIFLIGDLPAVLEGLRGVRMTADAMAGEGFREAAHIFHVRNAAMLGLDANCILARVERIFAALVREETNARIRLVEELPRVLEDAIVRALAAVKSCRLLSNWELLDLLSPLALAAQLDFLTGFTAAEAREMIRARLDMPEDPSPQTYDDERDRDRRDGALADEMNRRFRAVRLNARARDMLAS